MDRMGWGQEDLARILDRPLATVNRIIKGKKEVTAETAVALAKAFGTSPDYWMAKEAAFKLSQVGGQDDSVETRAKVYSKAPIKEMIRRRWIVDPKSPDKAEEVICKFLNIGSLDEPPRLLANARSSIPGEGFTSEQAVWCYRACQIAKLARVAPFKRSRIPELKTHLRGLCSLAKNVQHVPKLLEEYGIRLVILQHLTGTKIDGAAFWLDESSPVIAMSLRYDRVNYFWHTLAHEISHIDHRDAAVDFNSFESAPDNESDVEKRANDEASTTFIDEPELKSFIKRTAPQYTKKKIIQFANRIGVHPSVVVGQLQFRGELDWSQGAQLQSKCREFLTAVALTDGWGQYMPPFTTSQSS